MANSVAWEPAVISWGEPLSVSVMSTLELAQENVPTNNRCCPKDSSWGAAGWLVAVGM